MEMGPYPTVDKRNQKHTGGTGFQVGFLQGSLLPTQEQKEKPSCICAEA